MKLPVDDFMLLSLVNTALRDRFDSFEELCGDWDADESEISARLAGIGYGYDAKTNAFTAVI